MIKVPREKIAVSPIFDPDESPGGIIIPDIAKERCDQGMVKYIGADVEDIEIGDYVLFSGYTGTTVKLDGEGYLIIMHKDFVTCKVDNPDTDVAGLYFKGYDKKELEDKIHDIVQKYAVSGNTDQAEQLAEEVAELVNSIYFTATYEMAMNLIAMAYQDSEWRKGLGIKNKLADRPKYTEYDERMR